MVHAVQPGGGNSKSAPACHRSKARCWVRLRKMSIVRREGQPVCPGSEGGMIHRQNWQDVQKYLSYQAEIKQLAERTVEAGWSRLRHLIEWADDIALTDIQ